MGNLCFIYKAFLTRMDVPVFEPEYYRNSRKEIPIQRYTATQKSNTYRGIKDKKNRP